MEFVRFHQIVSRCPEQGKFVASIIGHKLFEVAVSILVEVRDSRTGYLLPARDGPGALPDGQSCWDAAVAVSCQNVTLISFSFRA